MITVTKVIAVIIGIVYLVKLFAEIACYDDNELNEEWIKEKYKNNPYEFELKKMKYKMFLIGSLIYKHDKKAYLKMRAEERENGIR